MIQDPVLEVKNLQVHFRTGDGTVQAVRDISFSLGRGRTLAIVGESGSGKSVTSKAIMGLLPGNARVCGGQILYGGQDLLGLSDRQMCAIRGSRIAMVFQDPLSALDPIVKIGKQLTEAVAGKLSRSKAREKAVRLLEEVGIPDPSRRMEDYPFQFSGGQRQRIVIAMALMADPEVLICDEPTTALDVTIQAQILDLLNRLKQQRNLSMLFITHDLGVVANVADDIAVMYGGKILEMGGAEEVFYDPRHPYTWALLGSMPDLQTRDRLVSIPGAAPDMTDPPAGDPFAPRNPYALEIDFLQPPPAFPVTQTHWAATWLLHPDAPKVPLPEPVARRIAMRGEG